MEIRVLQYFLTVVREESISRAAEALHITQPTLSRQLAQLEEETGVKLFQRGARRITLTNEGRLLRRRAEEMGCNYGTVKYRWQIGIRNFDMLFNGGDPKTPLGLTKEDIEWLRFTRDARRGMRNEWQIACELLGISKHRAGELRKLVEGLI